MIRTTQTSMLAACAFLLTASALHAAATPEQVCQNGRYAAAAQYNACAQKATGKYLVGGDSTRFEATLSKCRVKYAGTWAKLAAKAAGTGATCDTTRFTDNGTTVTDNLSGLQWEKKTDDATIHDKDNDYTWTAGVTAADGTVFTTFLPALNGGGCFAGQCDWRLPTINELQTILLSEPYPCTTSPCIDPVFGPTVVGSYWSATTHAMGPTVAWIVWSQNGFVITDGKASANFVRAVRAGL